jgi:hypothetical protein
MQFFGIFAFLLLLFTFLFTFTWLIGVIAVWARFWEDGTDLSSSTEISSSKLNGETSASEDYDNTVHDYPDRGAFDFLRKKPTFKVDGAMMPIEQYSGWERFMYNYCAPLIYFYRVPIVILFLTLAILGGYFTSQLGTKSVMNFLADDDPVQKAYTLSRDRFPATGLNDFSFVYVWGLNEKPVVPFKSRLNVLDYGRPTYWKFNITDPRVQEHLHWTWDRLVNYADYYNDSTFIDVQGTSVMGTSPWELWSSIENLSQMQIPLPFTIPIPGLNLTSPNMTIGHFLNELTDWLNLTALPHDYRGNITQAEWETWGWLFQAIVSQLLYKEPDSYAAGTLMAGTIGFD